ncbi:unnamed protein product, partial [Amoebophrya sp. A25]
LWRDQSSTFLVHGERALGAALAIRPPQIDDRGELNLARNACNTLETIPRIANGSAAVAHDHQSSYHGEADQQVLADGCKNHASPYQLRDKDSAGTETCGHGTIQTVSRKFRLKSVTLRDMPEPHRVSLRVFCFNHKYSSDATDSTIPSQSRSAASLSKGPVDHLLDEDSENSPDASSPDNSDA